MDLLNDSDENTCLYSGLACIFLTFSYVGSLYIWRSKLNRDHPRTIKRRFFSVFCMMLIAPIFTFTLVKEETLERGTLREYMGFRLSGMIAALIIPLLLTATLFLGPLTMHFIAGTWRLYTNPVIWISSFQELVWLRNHVMAPISEEWVFRSCMMPLLLQCLDPLTAVFTGPFLFGIAHFHHVHELLSGGHSIKSALFISLFQFSFTTVFGAYSAYLFLRTGHFFAPLVAHVFCNHLGFPNFFEVLRFPLLQRIIIIINYFLGLYLWIYLLVPLTSPSIYGNKLELLT
ncbi:CAAX prenyl protease 2 isoform X2 [Pararge aegeria]|uniref:CAAX prenyl protease 2 isoform X2 n=1 Tax=Pararge aegeria TaxID=116150 RepID=UPI0019CFA9E1|nr:CAAX prenyl protease 2 isoform X2 [Pararge aegeria]